MLLIPQFEDLKREVKEIERLRTDFHEAYLVECKETRSSCTGPPPAVELHRTVDAPTLSLLKAPNYPFLLCEEAPPAYVPPPVPFSIADHVDAMKALVMQVQEAFTAHMENMAATTRHSPGANALVPNTDDIVDFFLNRSEFVQLAWDVSSIQWFYRWVLSHSISCLWNAKDQLEYVLTEDGHSVPTLQEMDECLDRCPFAEAVNILAIDRQQVITQERIRLRSISRTYRERLPASAVTVATSFHLSSEEKYMYQEFFNQSEHLLLLLNHTLMMESFSKRRSLMLETALSASAQRAVTPLCNDNDVAAELIKRPSGEVANVHGMLQEAREALQVERDVISTLMQIICERKQNNIRFTMGDECLRSRCAQIAVYGCIVSDMNLMSKHMALVQEFLSNYTEWLRFHNLVDHEAVMQHLAKRNGFSCPLLHDFNCASNKLEDRHAHFIPPTSIWYAVEQRQNSEESLQHNKEYKPLKGYMGDTASAKNESRSTTSFSEGVAAPHYRYTQSPVSTASISNKAPLPNQRAPFATPPLSPSRVKLSLDSFQFFNGQPQSVEDKSQNRDLVDSTQDTVLNKSSHYLAGGNSLTEKVTEAYYALLRHLTQISALQPQRKPPSFFSLENDVEEDGINCVLARYSLERLWQIVAFRFTMSQLARHAWEPQDLAKKLFSIEEELLLKLRSSPRYQSTVPHAVALMAILHQALLLRTSLSPKGKRWLNVRVALHSSSGSGDDLPCEVDFALTPVELSRWGAVVDAIWFQADPRGAVHGDLLNDLGKGTAAPARSGRCAGFLRLEQITLPHFSSVPHLAPAFFSMCYRVDSDEIDDTESSSRKENQEPSKWAAARTLHTAIEECAEVCSDSADVCTVLRYRFVQRVVDALIEVEQKGLLPCFACRIGEYNQLLWSNAIFLASQKAKHFNTLGLTSTMSVSLVPPPALELMRMHTHLYSKRCQPRSGGGSASTTLPSSSPFDLYESPPSFCTIGLMFSSMLSAVATMRPVLRELYKMADAVREQAQWEVRNCVVPKAFVHATTHPIPLICTPTKAEPMSIEREAVVNQNTSLPRRFMLSLSQRLENYLLSFEFKNMERAASATMESVAEGSKNSEGPGLFSTTSIRTLRQTYFISSNNNSQTLTMSPSPSAVRPERP